MRWRTFAASAALAANVVLSCTCESKPPAVTNGDAGSAPTSDVAAVVADAAAATADVAALAADAGALCDRVCAIRASLACPRMVGDCVAACRGAVEGGCGVAWTAYFTCAAARPTSDYFCTDRGQPDLTPGICGEEHDAVERCLMGR
jgi:hypothetical protein